MSYFRPRIFYFSQRDLIIFSVKWYLKTTILEQEVLITTELVSFLSFSVDTAMKYISLRIQCIKTYYWYFQIKFKTVEILLIFIDLLFLFVCLLLLHQKAPRISILLFICFISIYLMRDVCKVNYWILNYLK
jgi:hypothetical protein